MSPKPPVPEAAPETIPVETHRVACDGGGVLGHPLVYLELGADGRILCPYCSRLFVKANAHDKRPDGDARAAQG